MDTQQIPEKVAGLIAWKELQIQNNLQAKERQAQVKKDADIETGRKILREKIAKALLSAPEWIREYDRTEREFDDNYLERIGRGWDSLSDLVLRFSIPGLPRILHNADAWMCATAKCDDDESPNLDFTSAHWDRDLEEVLVQAKSEMLKFDQMLIQHDERAQTRRIAEENYEQVEQERALKNQQSVQQERAETELLFAELKNDPIAILLMKAFLQIRQERSMFEKLLDDADGILISREERSSRKTDELRRQVADAERKAEEKRSRVIELEDDLGSIKKKLDHAERGF